MVWERFESCRIALGKSLEEITVPGPKETASPPAAAGVSKSSINTKCAHTSFIALVRSCEKQFRSLHMPYLYWLLLIEGFPQPWAIGKVRLYMDSRTSTYCLAHLAQPKPLRNSHHCLFYKSRSHLV